MRKIKEVIVVEGKHDQATLQAYFDCQCILTSGSHLGENVLNQIGYYVDNPGVIVFTDPDSVGERIRKTIMQRYPQVKHAYIEKAKAKTAKKVGIEHACEKDLQEALDHVATYNTANHVTLTLADLYELGLAGDNSAEKRLELSRLYPVGQCNAKTLLKRLTYLNIDKSQLRKDLYGKDCNL